MMFSSQWISPHLAIALMAGTVAAADTVAGGKVKSINADNKTFVLTDSANKDFTFKLGDKLVVNRAGKESKSDLKAGDVINVDYDKGIITWTANYILVQEGTAKDNELIRANIKGYDVEKKELTVTNEERKDVTYALGKTMVRVNMEDSKIADIKIGDHALIIVNTVEGNTTLRTVLVDRDK